MPAGAHPVLWEKLRTQTFSENIFMKNCMYLFAVVTVSTSLFIAGCTVSTPEQKKPTQATVAEKSESPASAEEAEIRANLAQLNPQDRKLAEAQKWCAVDDDNPLGEMGVPFKLMVKGEPVFLCCGGCKKNALADPDKTLAKVAALKSKVAGGAK
jgi:hypothetical protein